MNKLITECTCGEGFLKICIFDSAYDNEKGEPVELYFRIGGKKMYLWRDRLKAMWHLFRYGEYENYGIIIDRDSAEEIINYLNENKKTLVSNGNHAAVQKPTEDPGLDP